jgi:geranylgeranyl reductase family protein
VTDLVAGADVLWDLLVVGSGPGGAAAAIGARYADATASVLLLDRQDFPRDKTCGDAVLGTAFTRLGEYGVDTAALTAGFGPEHHLRLTSAGGTTVARPLTDSMTVLPRRVFDARLRDAALAAGAQPQHRTVRAVRDLGDHVEVDAGGPKPLRAKVVVGADGAESVVRHAVGGRDRRQVAIALRGYDVGTDDHTSRMVLDDRRGLAYAWRFPSDDGRANVGYGHLLRDGQVSSRSALAESMHRLLPGLDVDAATMRAARLPLSTSRQAVAAGRVLLVGDAASLVNPLTGEGIYYAIHSGLLAGTAAVEPVTASQRYRREMAKTFGRHHRHVAVMSALSGRAVLLEAGLRLAATDQRVFDDIAALALARGGITARVGSGIVTQLIRPRGVDPS